MNQQQQDFEKLFKTELESVGFDIPADQLEFLLPVWVKVMESSSLLELDCDAKTHTTILNELFKEQPKFNLFNISSLINTLTRKSPIDLGISLSQYNGLVNVSQELAKEWNSLVLPIRNKLMNKMQTQATLQMSNNGKNVIPPHNGRRG